MYHISPQIEILKILNAATYKADKCYILNYKKSRGIMNNHDTQQVFHLQCSFSVKFF